MFVDACAIVSLVAGEPTAADYAAALQQSKPSWTSALAAWEAIIVLARPDQLNCSFRDAEGFVVEWLEARDIALREPPSPREVLAHAVAVAENTASASARSATSIASTMPTPRRRTSRC